MTTTAEFYYRLPLSYVRVTGSKTVKHDSLHNTLEETASYAVTVETGADLLTRIPVFIAPGKATSQKVTWALLPDGRLSGAEQSTTAERGALLKVAAEASGTILGLAAPALIAAGPPGWIGLAGIATVAGAGAYLAGRGVVELVSSSSELTTATEPKKPEEIDASQWGIHATYVRDHRDKALLLAQYRAAGAAVQAQHGEACLGAATAAPSESEYWEYRLSTLHRIVRGIAAGSQALEREYEEWQASHVSLTTKNYDERFRIDDLPDEQTLRDRMASPRLGTPKWHSLVRDLSMAISVDLESTIDAAKEDVRQERETLASDDQVHHRRPRPAVIKVWKIASGPKLQRLLELVEVRRAWVAYPGNESIIAINSNDSQWSAGVTFDESGALVKFTGDMTDPRVTRARDASSILSALTAAADTGSKLRSSLAPPSLVDQAAEAKAAAELGLTPTEADPLEPLRKQLEQRQLQAQLNLADQLASTSTVPVIVTFPAS